MDIVIHVTGALAVMFGLLGQVQKTRLRLLTMAATSLLMWSAHFFLKGVNTSGAMCAIMSVRVMLGMLSPKWSAETKLFVTLLLETVVLTFSFLTWQGWSSLPATLASVVLTYSSLNLKYEHLRPGLMIGEAFWVINGIVNGSIMAVIAADLAIILNIYMLTKDRRARLQTKTA